MIEQDIAIVDVQAMALVRVRTNEGMGRLKASLSLVNTYDEESTLLLYREDGRRKDHLWIPRGLTNKQVSPGTWEEANITFTGELRPEQMSLCEGYLNHIKKNNGGIIQSPVGSGKTVMAVYIMAQLGLKTIIIVPTDYLMNQWIERLKTFSLLKDRDIGQCRGDICQYIDKKVVVAMVHSACKPGRYPADFYNRFGLMVVDEVHTLGARTFSEAATLFYTKHSLGLSATPRRKDGMQNVFFWHIGKICTPAPRQKLRPRVIMVQYNGIDGGHDGCVWSGNLSLGKYYTKLGRAVRRTEFISGIVQKLYTHNKDILLLTNRITHIDDLRLALIERGVPSSDIGIFHGTDKSGVDKKIILATYGSAGLGADLPRLTAVVLAMPKVDVEQNIGRVLREEKDIPSVVIDIVDTASSIMKGWASARVRFYNTIAESITRL